MNSNLRLLILFCAYCALSFSFQPQQSSLSAQPCNLCGTTASEWIAGITIDGGIGLDAPGGGLGGCLDQVLIDGYVAILKKGVSHTFSLSPGFSGAAQSEYWKIWIDLNHDGDFNDSGDLVYASGSGSTTTVSGTFFIPLSVSAGPSRIRVAMRRGSPPPECGNYTNGQELTYKSAYIDECDISFYDACAREYIKQVNLQTINNATGCGASGYQDFTNISTTLNPGNAYSVQLTPGFNAGQHPERWLIWIDFNNDYDYDDAGERVFDSGAIGSTTITTGSVNIPSNAQSVTTRMRVKMIPTDANTVTQDPCDPVPGGFLIPDQYGEAEDYTVSITNAPPTPTFLLTTSVNSLSVCAGTNGIFTTNLTSIQGFNSPVALSVTGGPSGATVNISPNPIIPTGAATVTLSGLTAGMVGNYTLTVTGMGGNITQTATVSLAVIGVPGVPVSLSPTNGQTGINTSVSMSWTTVASASTYVVEVAKNPAFSAGSIVWSQPVSSPSTTVSGLETDKVYYWRIQAKNACGAGNYSATYAFQTGQILCDVGPCAFTYLFIDENSVNTVQFSLDMDIDRIITDVNVSFNLSHTWVGDLSARFVSPYNDNILLFDRPGFPASPDGCGGQDANLVFDTQAASNAAVLENQCNPSPPALNGTFRPIESLNVLNGKSAKGAWTILVTDNAPLDGGGFTDPCVSFCLDSKIPPGSILTNKVLTVTGGGSGIVDLSKLKMTTTGTAQQGQFIVLSLPLHGSLRLNGVALVVGGTFTQADINNNVLTYFNNGDGATIDNFHFDALDQNNNSWVHDGVFNITITGIPLTATATITNSICAGEFGEITVTASGGQLTYVYSLNGGSNQTSNVFSITDPGTYIVKVTDNTGLSVFTNQVVLVLSPPLAPTLSGPQFMCPVGSTALLQVNQSWNAYLWSNGETTKSITITQPGLYEVTVTNQFGCTGVGVFGVQSGEVSAVPISQTALSICAGQMDTLKVLGSFSQYHWSNNVNTMANIVTTPGTYTVTVTNAYGCTGTNSVTIALCVPPIWTVTPTGRNHTIIVPDTLKSDVLGGGSLQIGDRIGVFYDSTGTGILKCAGFVVWSGSNTSFAAYGNDATAPARNGFNTGEVFKIKIWRAATNQVFDAKALYKPIGSLGGLITQTNAFADDAISMITSITVGTTHAIALNSGWNLISSYVVPSHPDMVNVFSPIVTSIDLVKNCTGSSYIPLLMINGIGDWHFNTSYQVKANKKDTLLITGQQLVPEANPIPLNTGWNCIGYYRDNPKNIAMVFSAIQGQINLVKNNDGKIYSPQFGINTIGNMLPGQGYKVKALSNTTLLYQANFTGSPVEERGENLVVPNMHHFVLGSSLNTGNNATIILTPSVAESILSVGDEIGVFTPSGILCGTAIYQGENLAITVWGDDLSTNGIIEGMQVGEAYHFKVWNSTKQEEYTTSADFLSGVNAYAPDAIEVLTNVGSISGLVELATVGVQILQLYPNPASETLNISMESKISGKVSLTLLSSTGTRVLDAAEIEYLVGNTTYNLHIPAHLPSGLYWLRFQFEEGIIYRQVVLQK